MTISKLRASIALVGVVAVVLAAPADGLAKKKKRKHHQRQQQQGFVVQK